MHLKFLQHLRADQIISVRLTLASQVDDLYCVNSSLNHFNNKYIKYLHARSVLIFGLCSNLLEVNKFFICILVPDVLWYGISTGK